MEPGHTYVSIEHIATVEQGEAQIRKMFEETPGISKSTITLVDLCGLIDGLARGLIATYNRTYGRDPTCAELIGSLLFSIVKDCSEAQKRYHARDEEGEE